MERGRHYEVGGLRFLGEFPTPPLGRATCVLAGQRKGRSDGHTGCQCTKSDKEPQPLLENALSLRVLQAVLGLDVTQPARLLQRFVGQPASL